MSKGFIKGIVFGTVFIVAVVLFSFSMNHTNEDLTAEMKAATLPVVNLYYQDEQINELGGYGTYSAHEDSDLWLSFGWDFL